MGGDNSKTNLVDLTAEEHFVAHQLLVKIYPDESKLVYAASWMRSRVANNKQYGWIRRKFTAAQSQAKLGKPRTMESIGKQKATIALRVMDGSWNANRRGRTITVEQRRIISEANKGKEIPIKSRSSLEGYILRYGEEEGTIRYKKDSKKKATGNLEFYINKYGEEEGTKRYQARQLAHSKLMKQQPKRTWSDTDKERLKQQAQARPIVQCPHCDKEGTKNIMQRWHFDNCKLLKN